MKCKDQVKPQGVERGHRERTGSLELLKTMSWPVPEQRNHTVTYPEIKQSEGRWDFLQV